MKITAEIKEQICQRRDAGQTFVEIAAAFQMKPDAARQIYMANSLCNYEKYWQRPELFCPRCQIRFDAANRRGASGNCLMCEMDSVYPLGTIIALQAAGLGVYPVVRS